MVSERQMIGLLKACDAEELYQLKQHLAQREIQLNHEAALTFRLGEQVSFMHGHEPIYGVIEQTGITAHKVRTDTGDVYHVQAGFLHHLK
jgi:hypothetical protein